MSKQLVALLLCLAYVQGAYDAAQTQTFQAMGDVKIRVMTDALGAGCGPSANPNGISTCVGGLERELVNGHVATNAIPAVQDVLLKYEGSLPQEAYISLIDNQYNCNTYSHLSTPNNLNSGIQRATAITNVITIPQSIASVDELLSSTQNGQEMKYRLCYSCNNANTGPCPAAPATSYDWKDSGIEVHISRLNSVTAYNVVHKTEGTIPNHADLHITYDGQLNVDRWLSFVDDTLNSHFPCGAGYHAAGAKDSSHSGALLADSGTKEFNFPSSELSAAKRFAVCYTESGGLTSSQWRDSGIRVRRSAIVSTDYGVDSKFGEGFTRTTWNRYPNRADNAAVDIASDRFPRIQNAMLQVAGDLSLATSSQVEVSLVEASLMNANPCLYPQIAEADPATFNYQSTNDPTTAGLPHGPNRRFFTGSTTTDSSGKVIFLQGLTSLLDHDNADCSNGPPPGVVASHDLCDYTAATERVYALCYSMGADSDRPSLTPNADGWSDSYIRFKLTDVEAIKHHGVLHATNGQLPQSTTAGTAGPGSLLIEYQATSDEASSPAVGFAPGASTRNDNRLYFVEDSAYTPANEASSDPCASIAWGAPADSTLSGVVAPETLTTPGQADNTFFELDTTDLKTGAISPSTGTLTKTYFAVCYSRNFVTSSEAAAKWFDTGIRLTVSKISAIQYGNVYGGINYASGTQYEQRIMYPHWRKATSDSATFKSPYASWDGSHHGMNFDTGQSRAHNVISQEPDQVIEYVAPDSGSEDLGNTKWVSLVDATLNGGADSEGNWWSKPCAYMEASKVADSSHSGVMQAGSSDPLVTVRQNVPLSEDTLFAVCYAVQTGTSADLTWDDSYVRVRVSQVSRITSVGVVHEINNDDIFVATIANRGDEMLEVTYEGTLPAGSRLSLVDQNSRGTAAAWDETMGDYTNADYTRKGNTMVCQDHAATTVGSAAANAAGSVSGALSTTNVVDGTPDGTSKTVRLITSTLQSALTFAVCYEASANSWHDTGIRVRRTEFSSVRFYNLYAAPAAREQTSIFKSTNRIPQAADTPLKYVAEPATAYGLHQYTPTANGRYVSLVALQSTTAYNQNNPCTVSSLAAGASADGAADTKWTTPVVQASDTPGSAAAHLPNDCASLSGNAVECAEWKVPQAATDLLDASATFALCYCNDCDGTADHLKLWYDSYIRFDISNIAAISQKIGKWGPHAGVTLKHFASGQIPNMKPAIENVGLSTEGMANQNLAVIYEGAGLDIAQTSFSLVDWQINPSQQYGIDYYSPCADNSLWTDPTLSTTPVANIAVDSTTTAGTVTDLDTTMLDTDRTFALCYQITSAGSWRDSGIRLTVPKLINVQRNSIHAGIVPRDQTAVFRPTNRLPQSEVSGVAVQLKYLGNLPDSQFVKLIVVDDTNYDSRNPCVTESSLTALAGNDNTGTLTSSNKVFTIPTANLLTHKATVAVCYTDDSDMDVFRLPVQQYQSDGVTPKNDLTWSSGLPYQNTRWRDSYIRMQITKVSALSVVNLVSTTDGQIPNTHAGMYFKYLGELAADKWISLVEHENFQTLNDFDPCADTISTTATTNSGRKQAASGEKYINDLDTTLLDVTKTFSLCYSESSDGLSEWVDSGIRLTLPKIFSVEASSQHSGGSDDCKFIGGDPTYYWSAPGGSHVPAYTGSCKKDTMARQQTSKPLSTNRLNQDTVGEQLTYVGGLPANGQVAIVKATLNPTREWDDTSRADALAGSSPCLSYNGVHSTAAATCTDPDGGTTCNIHNTDSATCTAQTDSSINACVFTGSFDTASGSLRASNNTFTLPASTEFEEGVIVAICYYDDAATTPLNQWRDSLIRLKVSAVGSFTVKIPTLNIGATNGQTSFMDVKIKTVGQIPRQQADTQVQYEYSSTPTHNSLQLALVEDLQDIAQRTDGGATIDRAHSGANNFKQDFENTYGFDIHHPCEQYSGTRTSTQQSFGSAATATCFDPDGGTTCNTYNANSATCTAETDASSTPCVFGYLSQDLDTFSTYQDSVNDGYHEGSSSAGVQALISNDRQTRGAPLATDNYDAPAGTETAPLATIYALCYTSTSGWSDSGIRVTLSQLDEMHYRDTQADRMYEALAPDWLGSSNDALAVSAGRWKVMWDHTTKMHSAYSSTNQIPQLSSIGGTTLTYGRWTEAVTVDPGNSYIRSDLIGDSYVSIVDASLNNNNPCADPAQAAHIADTQHSGALRGGKAYAGVPGDPSVYKRSINLAQNVQLSTSATFAACYSDSRLGDAGQTTDPYWRDSYIRFTISAVESVVTYGVVHKTIGGQIPNNPALKLNYVGSLADGNTISLVETEYLGSFNQRLQDHFPCAYSSIAGGSASALRSGASTAGVAHATETASSGVTIDTSALSTVISLAVCYNSSGTWTDSGIRVTLPKLYSFMYQSRYWSTAGADGTPNRDFTSFSQVDGYDLIDTPTNRLPRSQYVGSLLDFNNGVHSTATAHIDGTEILSIVKVDGSINNGDPCTDPVIANPGKSGFGASVTASTFYSPGETLPNTVDVNGDQDPAYKVANYEGVLTQHSGTLLGDAEEEFAICYTTGDGSAGDRDWRDTYVRVKITLMNSLVVANVRHFTDGHIPNTAASDNMRFHYDVQGSLGAQKYISLVDSTLQNGLPCAGAEPAVGSASSDNNNWFYIDGSSNGFTERLQPHLKHWEHKATHSGPHRAMPGENYIQGLDTRYLDKSASFAVCYGSTRTGGVGAWYDSGIRVTVSRVASVEYSACANCGPTKFRCSYVDSADGDVKSTCDTNGDGIYAETCVTRAPCDREYPFNGGCGTNAGALCQAKEDTAPRVITSAIKAFNRLPTEADVTFNVVGDLPANSKFSLVRFNVNPVAYCSNPFYTSQATCVSTGQTWSSVGAEFSGTTLTNGDVVEAAWNPCVHASIAKAVPAATVPPLTAATCADPDGGTTCNGFNTDSATCIAETDASSTPCVFAVAGTSTLDDRRAYSGEITASGMSVTIPQISDGSDKNRLDATLGTMYALCYNPDPSSADSEWRDAYLRVKMSKVSKLRVSTVAISPGTATNAKIDTDTNVITTGQLPNQAIYDVASPSPPGPAVPTQQVQYYAVGGTNNAQSAADMPSKIALVWLRDLDTDGFAATCTDPDRGTTCNTYNTDSVTCTAETDATGNTCIFAVAEGTLQDLQTQNLYGTASDWGMKYLDPCQQFGYEAASLPSPSTHATTRLAPETLDAGACNSNECTRHFPVLDLSALDSEKTYAVCYADGDTGNAGDIAGHGNYVDSGIRVTLPTLTQMDYSGSWDLSASARLERTRTMSDWLLATNVLPQVPNVELSYFHSTDSVNGLTSDGFIAIVDAAEGQDKNGPCADYLVAEASSSSGTGAVQSTAVSCTSNSDCTGVHGTSVCSNTKCTGGTVTVPQTTLLNADKIFAVCYAQPSAGDSLVIDFTTWRDSYIRLTISQIQSIESFSVSHETTGQVANHRELPVTVSWTQPTTALLDNIYFVHDELSSPDSEVAMAYNNAKSNTYFPCTMGTQALPATEADYAESSAVSGNTATIDTRKLTTYTSDGGTVATPRHCWNAVNGDVSRCIGSTNWGHRTYAVCYKRTDSKHFDSGIRLTVSQVATLMYSSEYLHTSATRTAEDVTARYMSASELAINTFPISSSVDTTLWWKRDQATNLASAETLPLGGTHFKLMSTASDSDPCAKPGNVLNDGSAIQNNAGSSSSYTIASRGVGKVASVSFDKAHTLSLAQADTYAVCYSGGDGSATDYGFRDSYVRLKPSKIHTFSARGVTHTTFGQIPSVMIGEKLRFTWDGSSLVASHISLVAAHKNNNFPCSSAAEASHAADSLHSGPVPAEASLSSAGSCVTDTLETSTLTMALSLTDSPVRDTMVEDETADVNYYYDQTSHQQSDRYYALCYSENYGAQTQVYDPVAGTSSATTELGSWYDSGIRLTTPSLTQVDRPSEYDGTATRVFTSFPVATNRIPAGEFTLLYSAPNAVDPSDALGAGKYISLVATTATSLLNQNNPCVSPADAALVYNDNAPAWSSGAAVPATTIDNNMGSSGNGRTFTDNDFLAWSSGNVEYEYAVCYSGAGSFGSNSGDNADVSWRDSYIRLKITEVEWFGTKGLRHHTTGQLPYHKIGLVFEMSTPGSTVSRVNFLTLVDETINPGVHNSDFTNTFDQPCWEGTRGSGTYRAPTSLGGNSITVDSQNSYDDVSTEGMDTTKTYAVCYHTGAVLGQGATQATSWTDSGIRVTISSMWGIQFSGFSRQDTETKKQRWRTITSTVPELQPAGLGMTNELASHVLPKYSSARSMNLVYIGDLPESQWVAVAEWTDPCVSSSNDRTDSSDNRGECSSFTQAAANNPCSKTNLVSSTAHWNGRACYTHDQGWDGHTLTHRCDYYTGASTSGNKEINFDNSNTLDSSKQYTFCYSTDTGSTWTDSFIRFSVSDVESLTASQVSPAPQFTDHGHLGNYDSTVKLQLTLDYNSASADGWLALVDETITAAQHPCTGDGFWSASGAVPEATLAVKTTLENSYRFGGKIWGQSTFTISAVSGSPGVGDIINQGNTQYKVVELVSATSVKVVLWDLDGQYSNTASVTDTTSAGALSGAFTATLDSFTPFPTADIVRASSPGTLSGVVERTEHKLTLANVEGHFAVGGKITAWSQVTATTTMFDGVVQFGDYQFGNDLVRPLGTISTSCVGAAGSCTQGGHTSQAACITNSPLAGVWTQPASFWTDQAACEVTNGPFIWTAGVSGSGYTYVATNKVCHDSSLAEAPILTSIGPNWHHTNVDDCKMECDYTDSCVAFAWWADSECRTYTECDTQGGTETNNLVFTKDSSALPSFNTYVGAKATGSVVELETEFMDVTKQYVACYKGDVGASWKDTGIRFTVSKLHTIRYNQAETPLDQFKLDFTTGRAKVGNPVCVSIGANPEPVCGANSDEHCALGSICDPDWNDRLGQRFGTTDIDGIALVAENRNGGCGTNNGTVMGQCASSVGAVTYVCLSTATPAAACDNNGDGLFSEMCASPEHITCSTNSDCESHDLASRCVTFTDASKCMLDDALLVAYSQCAPDTVDNGGCGAAGKCSIMHSPTVYNHVKKNILPQPGTGLATDLLVFDNSLRESMGSSRVLLLASDGNNGRPCLLAQANVADALSVGLLGQVSIIGDSYSPDIEYTICYDGKGVGVGSHTTHGEQWFDTFIRLRFSEVASVTHHGAVHTMQGHLSNSDAFGLTYSGKVEQSPTTYIALTEETQNSFDPCSAPVGTSSLSSGPKLANTTLVQALFDTTTLDTTKNFAVCYGATSTTMADSGIRVTVATMNKLGYNWGQYSDHIPERRYERLMYSTNVAPVGCGAATCASDTDPAATNRLPVPGGIQMEFTGAESLSNVQVMVIVDSSRNNNNPCMDFSEILTPVAPNINSGQSQSTNGPSPRRFVVDGTAMLSGSVSTYTTCYCSLHDHDAGGWGHNGADVQTCRDSYIHMKPTMVQTITAYGQAHRTTGQVASRATLGLQVDKDLTSVFPDTTQGKLRMVDETLNNYHPCSAAQIGGVDSVAVIELHETVRTFSVKTDALSATKIYAVCYKDGLASWQDAGIRLTVPKVTDITYSAPVRTLAASSCFAMPSPHVPGGIANCHPDPTKPSRRYSQLPQSHQLEFNYNGESDGNLVPDGYTIRLVDHELGYNDPCRTGATANGTEDRRQTTVAITTAAGRAVTVSLSTGDLLDYDKTFALCYSEAAATSFDDTDWRDSFIRITWSSIHTLKIHDNGNFDVTTKGMVPAVPQLRIEWAFSSLSMPENDNNNHYSPWIRLTAANMNDFYPCEAANADQVAGVNSTAKVQVLAPANEFVVLDTSVLGGSTGANSFVVCAATGDGSTTDTTWEDSGIRVRAVRWANSAKSRVVSGAPALLYFDLNTGNFDTSNGKVALVAYDSAGNEVSGCDTAKDALANANPYYSTGNAVMRRVDYRCKNVGADADSSCDAGGPFHSVDEVKSDRCIVGAICTPEGSNAGGCGSNGGECSAAIQLPTGKPYTGLRETHAPLGNVTGAWQDQTVIESELQAGAYSMCVCDDLNGNGGCDDANEWTVVFNSNGTVPDPLDANTLTGGSMHVIAKPRLGRDQVSSLRHIQNRSHQYNIRAGDNKTGYNVQNNDRIYFAPASQGCAQKTSWSGDPSHWRTMPTTVCTAVDVSAQATCDTDGDGRFEETCVVGAQCKGWATVHGCGATTGVCESPRVTVNQPDQTAPILIRNLTEDTATFVTPETIVLQEPQTMVVCYATVQSFYNNDPTQMTEMGDYAELQDTLEVIVAPQVGPSDTSRYHINQEAYISTTSIRAIENTSPKFKVNSLAAGDLIYFMPRTQPPGDSQNDCTPYACTTSNGSLISATACDNDFDGVFDNQCSHWAACDPSLPNNGGCGSQGVCEKALPPANHASRTAPAEGTSFVSPTTTDPGTGLIQLPTDVTLSTVGAALDTSCTAGIGGTTGTTYGATPHCQPGSAKYFVTCFIPKGAIVHVSNVERLSEDLTILKEPTAALDQTYYEGRMYNLDFTSPQQGDFNRPDLKEFSTGLAGDCVVLTQATDCSQAYTVSSDTYFVGLYYNTVTGQYEDQHRSMRFDLEQADQDKGVMGDIKGGIASHQALAQGKVNELPQGNYKICYATMNSECDQPEDFSMLSKTIEILPRPMTGATLRAHVTVQLGHDMVVDWSSNKGLSSQDMIGETWIGLYDKGACLDTHPQTLRHMCQPEGGRKQPIAYRTLETVKMMGGYCESDTDCLPAQWKEKCEQHHDPTDAACNSGSHMTMCYQNRCTGGIDSGTVRFAQSEYMSSGDYDIRLFQGDARNKNGIFCGGMTGTPSETYTQCVYESSVAASVKVYNDFSNIADLNGVAGLEGVWHGDLFTAAKAPSIKHL